jgi:hypothetical protein
MSKVGICRSVHEATVILIAAKDLTRKCAATEILRFAQDDDFSPKQ